MYYLYNTFFFQPLLNALVYLHETIAFGDLGLAIILLTVLIRLVLYPLFKKSTTHQMAMQAIQPKLKKLQEEHKGNPEAQSQAIFALFKEHKVNPFSGFLLLLVQLPILIALYGIFSGLFTPGFLDNLYGFMPRPSGFDPNFLGLINLAEHNIFDMNQNLNWGHLLIVGLAALAQYYQGKLALQSAPAANDPAAVMSRRMMLLMPFITIIFFVNLPTAVSLYWATSSVLSILQQYIINHQLKNGQLGTLSKTDA